MSIIFMYRLLKGNMDTTIVIFTYLANTQVPSEDLIGYFSTFLGGGG